MGIYVFDRWNLETFLESHPAARDFGHDVVPGLLADGARVAAHRFDGYWRDIADLDAYHGALLDVLDGVFEPPGTGPRPVAFAPSARLASAILRDSWIGPGARVQGARVERSVVGTRATVGLGALVRRSVILDGATIGAGARLRNVVVEQGAALAAGAVWEPERVTVVGREPLAIV